ncbi:MAG: DUF5060 domain-containing protein [Planctomycetota bacterium]
MNSLCFQVPLAAFWAVTLVSSLVAEPLAVSPFQKVELSFEGPNSSESATPNPFVDYRLDVRFTHGDQTMDVVGFYAADGNAANTSASKGNVWKCRVALPSVGKWAYAAKLSSGEGVRLLPADIVQSQGKAIAIDNAMGEILVREEENGSVGMSGFRGRGMLTTSGRYYKFSGESKPWIKSGANSPENLLAFEGFDETRRLPAKSREGEATVKGSIHSFVPHLGDWQDGDPAWGSGGTKRGQAIIGLMNYLAASGVNSVYFLSLNIGGDGNDVWPYASPEDQMRMDCSKLDQWEILFEHMQDLGLACHFITQETEMEKWLDDGDVGPARRLYYSELISRFAHHPAVVWNLGEENGPANFSPNGQSPEQQKAMADAIRGLDPYDHPILIHSHAAKEAQAEVLEPLLGHPTIDGVSLQVSQPARVHADVLRWLRDSADAGKPWVITQDEIGPADTGAKPDADDFRHDLMRQDVMWGSLMAGASGVEWYFGYKYDHNDLGAEDLRSREELWRQTRVAREFFEQINPSSMKAADHWVDDADGVYLLVEEGSRVVGYMKNRDAAAKLMLRIPGNGIYRVSWFDPLNGGAFQEGSVASVEAGAAVNLGMPPTVNGDQDWGFYLERN